MEKGGSYGKGEDPGEQFHRNEAISAVADDGFLVEEEDDDYEDLYNDVNVGEGFLQSLKKNDEPVAMNVNEFERKIEAPQQFSAPPPAVNVVPQGSGGAIGGGTMVSERVVENFENQGMRGPLPPATPGGGLWVGLGQVGRNMDGSEEQHVGPGQGFIQPPLQQPPVGGGGGVPGYFQHQQPHSGGNMGNLGNERFDRGGNVNANGIGGNGVNNAGMVGGGVVDHAGVRGVGGSGGAGGGGEAMLFVGDLHWWTTDAELEAELCKYGVVKEIKFYDEKASGKSKGYCQVEFYDPGAAAACKEGMNGHEFNGRPCVVAFANAYNVKRMGEALVSRTQQSGQAVLNQPRRMPNDNGGKPTGSSITTFGNFQGGADNNRGSYGRGNWGRGNSQGMANRGGGPGGMRRGGGMGGRGVMGNGGNAFNPQMMHPQAMMAQGFDPAFGGPMGRMGGFGGFPGGPMAPFSGMMQPFPPVGGMGMPGVAPHVNPAFFGRGMPMNGMVPSSGMDGPNGGMWQDPNMAGWGAEDHPGRGRESSYGEEVTSDQYGEASQERVGRQGKPKEKDRGSERDWSASSNKKYREEEESGANRDVSRDNDSGIERNYTDGGRHHDERYINRSRDREQSRDRDGEREREKERDREREREKERDREREREKERDREREREKERDREREREKERDRERNRERERDRYRDNRDKYADPHRHRDRESERDAERERGPSSRSHSKSRYDDDRRPRSRDGDYEKKRRVTSE